MENYDKKIVNNSDYKVFSSIKSNTSKSLAVLLLGFSLSSNADTIINAQSVGNSNYEEPSSNTNQNEKTTISKDVNKGNTFGDIIDNLGASINSEEAYILLGKYYSKKMGNGVIYYTRYQLLKLRELLGIQNDGNLFNSKDINSLRGITNSPDYFNSGYYSNREFQLKDISLNDNLDGYSEGFNEIYLSDGVVNKNGKIKSGTVKIDSCKLGSWCDKNLFEIENPISYSEVKYKASLYSYDKETEEVIK